MKRVYLDHNATTRPRPEVRAHLLQTMEELEGNPSSVHRAGRQARAVLDDARARTAAALGVALPSLDATLDGLRAELEQQWSPA